MVNQDNIYNCTFEISRLEYENCQLSDFPNLTTLLSHLNMGFVCFYFSLLPQYYTIGGGGLARVWVHQLSHILLVGWDVFSCTSKVTVVSQEDLDGKLLAP